MFWRRRKGREVEEIGIIRRTIQDVLVPEMQGIKERLAAHDEKFVAIDRRFDALDKSVAELRTVVERLVVAVERIESRLHFVEFDKRLYRLEILQEQAGHGSKSAPAA